MCVEHDLILTNTQFRTPNAKTATYREKQSRGIPVTIGNEIQRPTHEQIDFIMTTRRWRNTIKDSESDTQANIMSDHYPVKAKLNIRLKGIK